MPKPWERTQPPPARESKALPAGFPASVLTDPATGAVEKRAGERIAPKAPRTPRPGAPAPEARVPSEQPATPVVHTPAPTAMPAAASIVPPGAGPRAAGPDAPATTVYPSPAMLATLRAFKRTYKIAVAHVVTHALRELLASMTEPDIAAEIKAHGGGLKRKSSGKRFTLTLEAQLKAPLERLRDTYEVAETRVTTLALDRLFAKTSEDEIARTLRLQGFGMRQPSTSQSVAAAAEEGAS
jgi:hypothetical protein